MTFIENLISEFANRAPNELVEKEKLKLEDLKGNVEQVSEQKQTTENPA